MIDADLVDGLRRHDEIQDAHVEPEVDGRDVILVRPNGFVYGPVIRDLVLDDVPGQEESVEVLVVRAIPARDDGTVDREAAVTQARAAHGQQNSPWLFRFVPPGSATEMEMTDLLLELLDCRRVSMTDSLALLGVDSLMFVELEEAIRARFDAQVDGFELFNAASVRELVRLVEQRRADPAVGLA